MSVKEAAAKVGIATSTLYEVENGRQGGTSKIHLLCALYGLRPKWVEYGRGPRLIEDDDKKKSTARSVGEPSPAYTLHGMQITPDEVEFGIEWGKLDEPTRSNIREYVLLLVAKQIRAHRSGLANSSDDIPTKPPRGN